ncbi:T9SS type A sorting domain-containing protein [candidate division KSB1 bacterium]|nr:T9SS type A sorting domain-containing protein [candidate division KSB1 bacterium]
MKNRRKLFTVGLVGVFFVCFNALAQEDNMFTNWEFDNGLDGWTFWDGGADADAVYELDDTGMLSGVYSVRWDIINGGTEVWYLQTYQTVPIWEGIEYFIDFLIAWEGPEELILTFVWELAQDPYTKYLQVDTVLYDFNQRIQYNFISDYTDETANLKIFVGQNVDAYVWLDRIYVGEIPLEDNAVQQKLEQVPDGFTLEQNYPNPFNPSTTFNFYLPESDAVTVQIVNVNGGIVSEDNLGLLSSGMHSYQFDAHSLASGIYFYRVNTASGGTQMKRCLLLK